MAGHGFYSMPTAGHYEVIFPDGKKDKFTLPSVYHGESRVYPEDGRWYKILNGRYLVVIGAGYPIQRDSPRVLMYDLVAKAILRETVLTGVTDRFADVSISPDGRVLALASEKGLEMINLITGEQRKFLVGYRVLSLTINPRLIPT